MVERRAGAGFTDKIVEGLLIAHQILFMSFTATSRASVVSTAPVHRAHAARADDALQFQTGRRSSGIMMAWPTLLAGFGGERGRSPEMKTLVLQLLHVTIFNGALSLMAVKS